MPLCIDFLRPVITGHKVNNIQATPLRGSDMAFRDHLAAATIEKGEISLIHEMQEHYQWFIISCIMQLSTFSIFAAQRFSWMTLTLTRHCGATFLLNLRSAFSRLLNSTLTAIHRLLI